MMKKIFYTALSSLFLALQVFSQPCVPGPYNDPGIYPDSATGLPKAVATKSYEVVITAVVLTDTMIMGAPATIDSIGIVGIVGLPASLTWETNSPSNYWPGGGKGCVLLHGNPQQSEVGVYPIVVSLMAMAKVGGLPVSNPYVITYYKLEILDSTITGIFEEKYAKRLELFQNKPNPFSKTTNIQFNSPVKQILKFTVYNLLGEQMFSTQCDAVLGMNSLLFDTDNLKEGIYLYLLSDGIQTLTRKMIISRYK